MDIQKNHPADCQCTNFVAGHVIFKLVLETFDEVTLVISHGNYQLEIVLNTNTQDKPYQLIPLGMLKSSITPM